MKIYICHANAGHGHRQVAEVIAQALHRAGVAEDEMLVIDALDKTPAIFKKTYPATYYIAVKRFPAIWGWFYENLDIQPVYDCLKFFRNLNNRFHAAQLLHDAIRDQPEAIICTHFLSAELFAWAKRKGRIKSKVITVITDFLPHTFWVNEGTDAYWVMGEDGKKELMKRGVPENQIHAKGIPVAPIFQPFGQREELLKKYDFDPKRFTLLLTSGSFGLGPQEAILKELEAFKDKLQCFVVTGNNAEMKATLEKQSYSFPVKIFGFVDFMADLMEASDLMIAKSGGSTTTESLAKGIAMIVMEPIPGQETRNAEVLKANNASFFMVKPEQIKTILKAIFDNPQLLEDKRKQVQRLARPDAADDLATFVLSN